MIIRVFIYLLLLICPAALLAQALPEIKLYPSGAPNSKKAPGFNEKLQKAADGSLRITKVSDPVLIPFLPDGAGEPRTAIIVCPGGGYTHLSWSREGLDVAKRLRDAGIAAFVLKYRLPDDSIMTDKSIGPLQDAQTAIKLIRAHAEEWHINTHRIGMIGFSAGGHLASIAGTRFGTPVIPNATAENVRPDFLLLIYPVITFDAIANNCSNVLLGQNATHSQLVQFSAEQQVTTATPPCLLIQANDDHSAPVLNSLLFYKALNDKGVPVELHIYQKGGHGFGLYNKAMNEEWMGMAVQWLRANQFLN